MSPGLSDLLRTFKNPSLFLFLAWGDLRARYRRSVLGPFWITLSTAIGVVGLGFIWSELFHLDRNTYIPMLTIGLVLWQFMSSCIIEASTLFVRQGSFIKNLDLPISLYPAHLLTRQFLVLLHNVPLFILVFVCLGVPLTWQSLWFFPGLALVLLNLYWIILLMSILGARFRDLEYLVSTIMPLLMFFTPVMYRPSSLPISSFFIWLNPLAHMIEIVRFPLLGEAIPWYVWAVNLGLLVVGGALTFYLFNNKRNRIALWI